MKKSQIWLLILIVAIPAIILIFFLIISDVTLKEFPWWTVIIPILIFVTPFAFLFAQRLAQRTVYDVTLQKKKKTLIVMFGINIIFLAIIFLLAYYNIIYPILCIPLSAMILTPVFFLFFGNYRLFFPKKKESAENNVQNHSEI